jgi:hypothetical protein
MFDAIAENLWAHNSAFSAIGFAVGHRMTVVKLKGGELFVHSPTPLDEAQTKALEDLGPIGHIVAPSRFHDLWLEPYLEKYQDVDTWAAPGFTDEHPKMHFKHVLGESAPDAWSDEMEQLIVGGMPKINETVFFHKASRTLIICDLLFNLDLQDSFKNNLFLKLNGVYKKAAPSRVLKLFTKDKAAAKRSVDQIAEWDFERIILGHGNIVEGDNCPQVLKQAFANW